MSTYNDLVHTKEEEKKNQRPQGLGDTIFSYLFWFLHATIEIPLIIAHILFIIIFSIVAFSLGFLDQLYTNGLFGNKYNAVVVGGLLGCCWYLL